MFVRGFEGGWSAERVENVSESRKAAFFCLSAFFPPLPPEKLRLSISLSRGHEIRDKERQDRKSKRQAGKRRREDIPFD